MLFRVLLFSYTLIIADISLAADPLALVPSHSSLPPALKGLDKTKVQSWSAKPRAKKKVAKSIPTARVPASQSNPSGAPVQVESSVIPFYGNLATPEEVGITEPAGTLGERMDVWVGNQPEFIKKYKEAVHHEDVRLNRMEITIQPGFLSAKARSNYYYRDTTSKSAALGIGANIWLTPFFGVKLESLSSNGADIEGQTSDERLAAKHDWFDLSLSIRKFAGLSRRSNTLELGLDYSDYHLNVPADTTIRSRLRTTGFGVHMNLRVPLTQHYAHNFGFQYFPSLDHKEDYSSLDISSGQKNEASRVGIGTGGDFIFSRSTQLTWSLKWYYENINFKGDAGSPEPGATVLPSNSSVKNEYILFGAGYRWGN
jgi:hypothetical protein